MKKKLIIIISIIVLAGLVLAGVLGYMRYREEQRALADYKSKVRIEFEKVKEGPLPNTKTSGIFLVELINNKAIYQGWYDKINTIDSERKNIKVPYLAQNINAELNDYYLYKEGLYKNINDINGVVACHVENQQVIEKNKQTIVRNIQTGQYKDGREVIADVNEHIVKGMDVIKKRGDNVLKYDNTNKEYINFLESTIDFGIGKRVENDILTNGFDPSRVIDILNGGLKTLDFMNNLSAQNNSNLKNADDKEKAIYTERYNKALEKQQRIEELLK